MTTPTIEPFDQSAINHIASEVSHDLRCATTNADGIERIRWNNRCVGGLLRTIHEEREAHSAALAAQTARADKLQAEVDTANTELDVAKREASTLATSIWRSDYQKDAPNWSLCDSVAGIISQIDNMYAGVRGQRDQLKLELDGLQVLVEAEKTTRMKVELAHETDTGLLTAELDAVRKERDEKEKEIIGLMEQCTRSSQQAVSLREEKDREIERGQGWCREAIERRKLVEKTQARCAELERAIREAPHGTSCIRFRKLHGECTCWKSDILSPQAEQKLSKGGDEHGISNTSVSPVSNPEPGGPIPSGIGQSSPDHDKSGEWGMAAEMEPCPVCDGNGIVGLHLCHECGGPGYIIIPPIAPTGKQTGEEGV